MPSDPIHSIQEQLKKRTNELGEQIAERSSSQSRTDELVRKIDELRLRMEKTSGPKRS